VPSSALVTGGGRGIGADIARALAGGGWAVTVTGRTSDQVEEVAAEIGGSAVVGDVSRREDVERMVTAGEPLDLLVANAGSGPAEETPWELDVDEWWHTFEVNVLGVHLCCRAAIPGMLARGCGRIVIVGSGASYLPGAAATAYTSSKAAVCRYGETLANALKGRIPVFVISPGLVRTSMTEGALRTMLRGRRRSWRRSSCSSSRPAASTCSRGAICTRSTILRTSSSAASSGSSRTT
jgi:NAD(P)-dependent dehydrogenase (short-subunit alcohol dehydrogenase family)